MEELKFNNSLKELENLKEIDNNIEKERIREIDTGIEYIDKSNCCFLKGNITALLGSVDIVKSLYATNLIYNALLKGKKIIYIATNASVQEIYQRLIVRNSWECFERGFLKKQLFHKKLQNRNFINKYNASYNDFVKKYSDKLYIQDTKKLKIIDEEIILKIFKEGINALQTIDVVIIDDIDNLILKDKKKLETSENRILDRLMKLMITNAKNFLEKEQMVNIIFVKGMSGSTYSKAIENMGHLKLDYIDKTIRILADEILFIYSDATLENAYRAKLQLLKALHLEMFTKTEEMNSYIEACCMGDNIKYFDNEENPINASRKFLAEMEACISDLEEKDTKENEEMKDVEETNRVVEW